MLGPIKTFLDNRKGAFAMQFALLAIPLTICTGLAIDGGRAFLARYELAAALDAAALAVGSTLDDDADINAVAQNFVNANFKSERAGPISLDLETSGLDGEIVLLKGQVTINTYFMPLVGQPTVTVAAESEVRRGGSSVEVALALDVTGSMAGSRIAALRDAAKDLIDTVVADVQEPYYSRIAIVPWANNVYVGGYADAIRGPVTGPTAITAATWRNGPTRNISAATWREAGTTRSIDKVERTGNPRRVRVTAGNHGYSNGDIVGFKGVNEDFTGLNGRRYKVSDATKDTFLLKEYDSNSYVNGNSFGKDEADKGTVAKCITSSCEVQVTASLHGLSAGDGVYISGVGGMTDINNNSSNGWYWEVDSSPAPTSSTFVLKNSNGVDMNDYTSGGVIQKCFSESCEVQVTSAGHGLSNDEYVQISGVSGMTQLNQSGNNSRQVKNVTTNTFVVSGTVGPSYGNYNASGSAQCLREGCAMLRFTNASGGTSIRPISNCISERVTGNLYTNAAPNVDFLGRDYAGSGANVRCESDNPIMPLTDDKDDLKDLIDDMVVAGSTAGQIGAAWGWYMVSSDWGYLWPEEKNRPAPMGTPNLAKVVVLMTDGEFNTAHCGGVVSRNYGVSNNSDRGYCNATNGAPFNQAEAICSNMKAAGVIVYTVGFELAVGGKAEDFMEECATSPQHAYLASSDEELREAFNDIATAISRLRISK